MPFPPPAPPAWPAPATLALWPVLRLMQELEQQSATAGEQVALYRQWLASGPHDDAYVAHFNLGTLYQAQGQPALAEAAYRAALALTELAPARFNLGLLLEHTGRLYEAMAEWRLLLASQTGAEQLNALGGLIRLARRTGNDAQLAEYLTQSLALLPQQAELAAELRRLSAGNTLQPADPADDPGRIYVMAVCFNEAAILPFFLDHYLHFVGASKIVLFDGGSTDGTAEIAARYPQVELVVRVSDKLDDRVLMAIRNEEWKQYRTECDWMVVCDVDEFLYHPQLRARLAQFKRSGVTLPMVEGFEMLSKEHPQHVAGRYIWQDIQAGTPNPAYYNKNLVFDPAIDINYTLGCHHCEPTGPVRRSDEREFKNLHYRMLSHRHIVEKSRRAAARLSDWNKQTNAGFHYRQNAEMPRADYNRLFVGAGNVLAPRPRPQPQRAVFDAVQQHLLALDENALLVELDCVRGFGHGNDSGSTELLAWYVHSFGGRLLCLDDDERALRNAAFALQGRGLLGPGVRLGGGSDALPARIDLLMCNNGGYLGDAQERAGAEQAALQRFQACESRLTPAALVVLDGEEGPQHEGLFRLLVPYLLSRGYQLQRPGYTTVYSRSPLSTNP